MTSIVDGMRCVKRRLKYDPCLDLARDIFVGVATINKVLVSE
jgi:hypothetical protein